jgi:formate hydrogenlyase subunit 3/multisubunit Na+/H+ antiporter MnhD subunit
MSALASQFGPSLLIAALAAPLIVLAAFLVPGLRGLARAITPLAAAPALAAAGLAIGGAPFGAELPALRVSLWLDQPGGLLLAAAALVWLIVSIFAFTELPVAAIADRGDAVQRASRRTPVYRRATDRVYKIGKGKRNADRFAVAWLLTMAGSLGVFIAADLLTFYLVYALVSVAAYYLVAHDEDANSRRAGGVYMAFALLGEAVLLIAFVMLAAGEPSGATQIRDVVAALPSSPSRDAALALIILGFGMKIALVPLHGWMPLTYTAAPIPAAAVLSGAAVKAGVIGLIRFLPLGATLPGWGEALVWVGFISAFYGVAIGVTQRDPKTMLAYSSISQMGVIAAAFGMALVSADQGAATNVAFYAANHVLVKAALFLSVGAVAALEGRVRTPALIVVTLLGLNLAGLPLTGGALAKLAVKDLFGDGAAGIASQLSAAATTALMLMFVVRLARAPVAERAEASRGRLWPWAALGVAALLIPWLMFPVVGSPAEAFDLAKLWDAIWPVLIGAALAAVLWVAGDRLPRIPAGDIVVAEEAAFRASLSLGSAFERADRGLREWPAAGLALLMVALALAAAGYASR